MRTEFGIQPAPFEHGESDPLLPAHPGRGRAPPGRAPGGRPHLVRRPHGTIWERSCSCGMREDALSGHLHSGAEVPGRAAIEKLPLMLSGPIQHAQPTEARKPPTGFRAGYGQTIELAGRAEWASRPSVPAAGLWRKARFGKPPHPYAQRYLERRQRAQALTYARQMTKTRGRRGAYALAISMSQRCCWASQG